MTTVRCGARPRNGAMAEKPPSATATMRRSGSQRATCSSAWRPQSVSFLKRMPLAAACRSEGAGTVRKGSPQTQPAQGTGAGSMTHSQRRPLALTKWPRLERTGSR